MHEVPDQGLNRYRLRVRLVNGVELISDVVENYFLTDVPFLVFPNPVPGAGDLRVFSKAFKIQEVTVRLYKSDGSLAFITKLFSDREYISLNNLAPGFYIYSITSEEGRFNGKLVVQ